MQRNMGLAPLRHGANVDFSRVSPETSVSLQADPSSLFSGFVTEVGCMCDTSLSNEMATRGGREKEQERERERERTGDTESKLSKAVVFILSCTMLG